VGSKSFFFLGGQGLRDGWGGDERKAWCMCEKVEMYISAQPAI
jgi:hypothetical protein